MKASISAIYCALLLIACQETKNSAPAQMPSQTTQIGNYPFWHHLKKEGATPKPGQIVQYHYRLSEQDSVIQNTFGGQPVATFFPTDEYSQNLPSALVEGLRQMTIGDSLTIHQPVGDNTGKFYSYELVIVKIMDSPIPPPDGATR